VSRISRNCVNDQVTSEHPGSPETRHLVSAPNWTEVEKIPAGRWASALTESASREGSTRGLPQRRRPVTGPTFMAPEAAKAVRRILAQGRLVAAQPMTPAAGEGSGSDSLIPPRHPPQYCLRAADDMRQLLIQQAARPPRIMRWELRGLPSVSQNRPALASSLSMRALLLASPLLSRGRPCLNSRTGPVAARPDRCPGLPTNTV
jgi:hypothetical protein